MAMTKILVTMDEKLVARVDREARRRGLTRSAFLARLAEREVGGAKGPGADPRVHQALRGLDRLFAENPHPGDLTEIVRRMRDSR